MKQWQHTAILYGGLALGVSLLGACIWGLCKGVLLCYYLITQWALNSFPELLSYMNFAGFLVFMITAGTLLALTCMGIIAVRNIYKSTHKQRKAV